MQNTESQEEKLKKAREFGDWYDSDQTDEITLAGLRQLCEQYRQKREEKKDLETKAKDIGKDIAKMEQEILEHLNENGMKNFSGDFGMIVRSTKTSFRQPDGEKNRERFFNYLKEQGIFDTMISVNSRTLTAWAKKEVEASDAEDWVPPGLDKPEIYETISLRKG